MPMRWTSPDNSIELRCCLAEELLAEMPDDSVDLVLTSPPFNQLDQEPGQYGFRADRRNGDAFQQRWAANGYHDDMPEGEYQVWLRKIVEQCIRVSRGLVWLHHKPRHRPEGVLLPERILPFKVWDFVIWDKRGSPAQNCGKYPPSFEFFLAFGRKIYWDPEEKRHGSVWTDAPYRVKAGEVKDHPCPWPASIAERLVRSSCLPGGLCCDPFMGRGSAAMAAWRLGRRFIGCDREARFFDAAVRNMGEPLERPQAAKEMELAT